MKKYKAYINFATAKQGFQKGQIYELEPTSEVQSFLKAGFLKEVKEATQSKKPKKRGK